MAEEHLTTGSGENKPLAAPVKAIEEERESSRSSQENGYWGDFHTEILMGLEQIKALGDLLVSVIESTMDSYKDKNYSPIDLDSDTLPTIGHLIQEKAARIKYLVEEGY